MMEILGYICSILIGLSLGMVGSGGSILTVPVLVYLMNVPPSLATTSSLFIVGATSLAGGIRAYSKKTIDFRAVTEFGIPSIFSIFITRHFLLPALPDTLFHLGKIPVSKDLFLMLLFALLMLAAAVTMIRNKPAGDIGTAEKQAGNHKVFSLMLLGLVIGMITGLLGAGGGFLIIPALVLLLKLPMRIAVGTSLLIIAINSLFGFLFSLKQFDYNWLLLISFTVLAIGGLFIGSRIAEKIPGPRLKTGFGWFILIMGIYIIIRELVL
jgi:uncharacterized protein